MTTPPPPAVPAALGKSRSVTLEAVRNGGSRYYSVLLGSGGKYHYRSLSRYNHRRRRPHYHPQTEHDDLASPLLPRTCSALSLDADDLDHARSYDDDDNDDDGHHTTRMRRRESFPPPRFQRPISLHRTPSALDDESDHDDDDDDSEERNKHDPTLSSSSLSSSLASSAASSIATLGRRSRRFTITFTGLATACLDVLLHYLYTGTLLLWHQVILPEGSSGNTADGFDLDSLNHTMREEIEFLHQVIHAGKQLGLSSLHSAYEDLLSQKVVPRTALRYFIVGSSLGMYGLQDLCVDLFVVERHSGMLSTVEDLPPELEKEIIRRERLYFKW